MNRPTGASPASDTKPTSLASPLLRAPSPQQLGFPGLVALGFGSGAWPYGPGTAGTLWGWGSFVLLDTWLSSLWPGASWPWALILLLGFGLGVWACGKTARRLGRSDPGMIVWDEILAFWLVLACLPSPQDHHYYLLLGQLDPLFLQALAFLIFRSFDILKPQPIRWLDQTLKGGLGIMVDDLMAAVYTLLSLALLARLGLLQPW